MNYSPFSSPHPDPPMLAPTVPCVRNHQVHVQQDQQHHRQAEPQGSHDQPLLELHCSVHLLTGVTAETPAVQELLSQTHHWRLEGLYECHTRNTQNSHQRVLSQCETHHLLQAGQHSQQFSKCQVTLQGGVIFLKVH